MPHAAGCHGAFLLQSSLGCWLKQTLFLKYFTAARAQPELSTTGSKGAAKKSSSAFLEPGAALAALPTLEALYEAVAPQHSLLSSFSAAQSADQARSALAGQAEHSTLYKPASKRSGMKLLCAHSLSE